MTPPAAIRLQDVRFSFSDVHASSRTQGQLAIFQWSVEQGERVFIQGASGTGKTTLLNLLMGIWGVKHGQIEVLGQRVDQMSSRQRDRFRAQNIGCIFQQFNLIPYLNPLENIEIAKGFANKYTSSTENSKRPDIAFSSEQLLGRLNLATEAWRRPVSQLSVGQQQRVAIARALIHCPRLIIADEPTSSLDRNNSETFMDLLLELAAESGSTLVFVSHDHTLARGFDRVEDFSLLNTKETVK